MYASTIRGEEEPNFEVLCDQQNCTISRCAFRVVILGEPSEVKYWERLFPPEEQLNPQDGLIKTTDHSYVLASKLGKCLFKEKQTE